MGRSVILVVLILAMNTWVKIINLVIGGIHICVFQEKQYEICKHALFWIGTKRRGIIYYMKNDFMAVRRWVMYGFKIFYKGQKLARNKINIIIFKKLYQLSNKYT